MNLAAATLDRLSNNGVASPPAHVMDMLIDVERPGPPSFAIEEHLKKRGVRRILDVATGVGYYSTRLLEAGFEVISADAHVDALNAALDYGATFGHRLNTVQVDWRYLRRSVGDGYDAVLCLSNAFSRLFKAPERRRALAEFLSVLSYDGFLLLDHRNYDAILNTSPTAAFNFQYGQEHLNVAPVFADDGLVQLAYHLPQEEAHYLNTYPIRKDDARRLILEVGFQQVKTYDVFKASNATVEPDYLLHVAEKGFEPRSAR